MAWPTRLEYVVSLLRSRISPGPSKRYFYEHENMPSSLPQISNDANGPPGWFAHFDG